MTVFRHVALNHQDEDGEYLEVLIVPESTTTLQLMHDPDEAEIVCSCCSVETADLIVGLLNEHYKKKGLH